tara:strand:+ start:13796 stop:14014 length:219 start_codon:yes stop_codon:yes gene_type:complete
MPENLEYNEEYLQKLEDLKEAIGEWQEAKNAKLHEDAAFLKLLNTPMEEAADTYVDSVAQELAESAVEEGYG